MKTAIYWCGTARSIARHALLLALATGFSGAAVAQQQPVFLGDNNTSVSLPGEIYMLNSDNGLVYFENSSITDEASLWQTDGTLAGTRLSIRLPWPYTGVNQVLTHNGYTYLRAFADYGDGLLKLNGPDIVFRLGGTDEADYDSDFVAVEDGIIFQVTFWGESQGNIYKLNDDDELIDLGPTDAEVLQTSGSLIFYQANDELWRTDGTPEGTVPVYQATGMTYQPYNSRAHGDKFFFEAYSDLSYSYVFATDGVAGDAVTLAAGELRAPILPFGDNVAFVTSNGSDFHLYISDGTAAGTNAVLDLTAFLGIYDFAGMAVLGDKLVFGVELLNGDGAIYVTDGTEAGTIALKDDMPFYPALAVVNNLLYFSSDYAEPGEDLDVWASDGTVAGTRIIFSFTEDSESWVRAYDAAGGQTVFNISDGSDNRMFAHDPATDDVIDLETGQESSNFDVRDVAVMGNKIVFRGFDGDHGIEPWASDGTVEGTSRLGDFVPGPAVDYDHRGTIYTGDNMAFFNVLTPEESAMFSLVASDGTPAGTQIVRSVSIPSGTFSFIPSSTPYTVINNIFYFLDGAPLPIMPLWLTDGDVIGDTGMRLFPADLLPLNGKMLVFTYPDEGSSPFDVETAIYDLATNTTSSLNVSANGIMVTYAYAGSNLFVQTFNPVSPPSSMIFVTDGTPEGTRQLAIYSGMDVILTGLHVNGKAIALSLEYESVNVSVYALDPEAEEPELLANFPGGTVTQFERLFKIYDRNNMGATGRLSNGSLVFSAPVGEDGEELWITDGTPAGTMLLKDINPGPKGSAPVHFTSAGDVAYFAADDGVHGRELWKTDGTSAGTVMVADINAGPGSGLPSYGWMNTTDDGTLNRIVEQVMVYNRGQLLFPASDGSGSGFDLWMFSSPTTGPEKIELTSERIELGGIISGSNPGNFVLAGDTVFFQATTPQTGRDLWVMPLGWPASVSDWALY